MTYYLLDGRVYDDAFIVFDRNTNRFYDIDTGEDLTRYLRQSDKDDWRNWDIERGLLISGGNAPNAPGADSTWSNLWRQAMTDPLGAPLQTLDAGVRQIAASSGVQTLTVTVLVVAGVVLFVWMGGLDRLKGALRH